MPEKLNPGIHIKHQTGNYAAMYGIALAFSLLTSCKAPPPQAAIESVTTGGQADANISLFYAAENNDVKKAAALLAAGANVNARAGVAPKTGIVGLSPYANLTPLHVAASHNAKDVATLLIEQGADVNAVDLGGSTPLLLTQDATISVLLLKHGASPNIQDSEGNTPLSNAIMRSNMELIKLLMAHGANINGRNRSGQTPLLYAARLSDFAGTCDVVQFLLDSGADPNMPDNEGETAIAIATRRNNSALSKLLRSHGAKLSETPSYADLEHACDDNDITTLKGLLAKLPDRNLVNWTNKNGAGLLWSAAANRQVEVVKLLLDNGANANIVDKEGDTPLHAAAAQMAELSAIEQHKALDIATMLLKHGADVNAKKHERDGTTPLDFAKANHQDRMVDLLRQHGGHE